MERTSFSLVFVVAVVASLAQAQTTDTTAPEIFNCPTGISTNVDSLQDLGQVTWTEPTAVDDSGDAVTTIQSHTSGQSFPVGFTAVTYVFRDTSNNAAVCNFVVAVGLNGDTSPPVITDCPSDFTIFVANALSLGTPTWTAPSATDETGQWQFTTDLSPLTSLGVGTYPVTYTFEDPSGNEDTCTFEVTIAVGTPDVTNPVLTSCPVDMTVANNGQNFVLVSWDAPTAFDNSGVVNQLSGPATTSQFYQAGTTNTINYVIYDPSGNSVTCSFVVTVVALGDTTDPVISDCPGNTNAVLGVGEVSTQVFWTEPSATDNSGSVSTARTHVPGQLFEEGVTTVIYTFTDASGNSASCSFDINVIAIADTTDPVVSGCPNSISVTIPTGSSGTSVTWTEPTATDDSGFVVPSSTSSPGDFFIAGTTTQVTYTFTDGSGNNAFCTFFVTVAATVDNVDPVITGCPNNINVAIPIGSTSVAVTWTEPTATDNSGSAVASTSTGSPGDSFDVGTTQVTYTFVDPSGNDAVCSFFVTVTASVDNIDPVISGCPNNINVAIPVGSTSAGITWTEPTATDNSGFAVSSTSTSSPGDSFDVGTTQVTYTFTDVSGNDAFCSFFVTVTASVDNVDPVITGCPENINVAIPIGSTSVAVTWTEPTATDNSGFAVSSTSTSSPGDSFDVGTTQVTYTFTDVSGNDAFCSFFVTVAATTDNTDPVIDNCPASFSVDAGNNAFVFVFWTAPTATDNSGTVDQISGPSSNNGFYQAGTVNTVTYVFEDGSGNQAVCSFDVTVTATVDNTDPVITGCPNDINVQTTLDGAAVAVTWNEPTATDDSGNVQTTQTANPGDSFNVGPTTVSYIFTDDAGNDAICSFTVTVTATIDTNGPQIFGCPNDITVNSVSNNNQVSVTWLEPAAIDDSGEVPSQSNSRNPGDLFPIGDTVVTYTFVDGSGNPSICSFTVTVIDTNGPVISDCPEDISVNVPFGTTSVAVTWTPPSATDNSGGNVIVDPSSNPGDSFDVGLTQVTYTFTDALGNPSVCSFNVFVFALGDDVDPVITGCPENIVVNSESDINGASVQWTEPIAFDNSGETPTVVQTSTPGSVFLIGSTTVTYTYSDAAGNMAICSFDITVNDASAPNVVNCPMDITLSVPFGTTSAVVTWTDPTATDNSGGLVTSTSTANPGDAFDVGISQVIYTFSDANNNPAICAFNIIIQELGDTTVPVVSDCPNTIAIEADANLPGANVDWTTPTAVDNDGSDVLVSVTSPQGFFTIGTTTVTYTFRDSAGNEAFCIFDVVVIDNTRPVVTGCPEDITLDVPFGTTSTAITWQVPTANDNSGNVDVTNNFNPGDLFTAGTIQQVSYTFTDNNNNFEVCNFFVTINIGPDMTEPVITGCPQNIVEILPDQFSAVAVEWAVPTATDNSGVVPSVITTSNSGDLFTVGTNLVVYTFRDQAGNEAECSFTVSVFDQTAPTFLFCPADITLVVSLGTPTAVATWTTPVAQDNSGNVNLIDQTAFPGDEFQAGTTTTVTYVYQDESGNPATCAFDVTINTVDDQRPVLVSCPSNIMVEVEIGVGGTPVTWVIPTATDNSGFAPLVENNYNPGDFFDVGSTVVIYTFTDAGGNEVQCAFNIAVTGADTTPPVIQSCPGDIALNTDVTTSGAVVNWDRPIVADASGDSISIVVSKAPGTFFDVGTTTVMYTFIDSSGNSISCDFEVTVVSIDEEGPAITGCPENILRTVLDDTTGGIITWAVPVATDNSGEDAQLLSNPTAPGSFFPVGTTTIRYTYSDGAGNIEECAFDIIIDQDSPCNVSPCENGGVCLAQSLTDYVCVCPGCYTGVNCQIELDPCAGNTCTNGGECVPYANSCTRYYCECPSCYYGDFCEQRVDACACNKCENGGVCLPTSTTSCTDYNCLCTGCFVGQFCENEYNPCNYAPCQNNGLCSNIADSCSAYSCECQGCFTGYNCDIAIPDPCDADPCANDGVCSRVGGSCYSYQCACQPGFAGPRCEDAVVTLVNPCNNFPCENGASCVCDNAQNYVCLCPPGFNGIHCEVGLVTSQDACSNNPCLNGGNCVNSYHSGSETLGVYNPQYTCVCADGFTGTNCALTTANNPAQVVCDDDKCQNNGICSNTFYSYDQSVSYFCECPIGFFGECCELTHPDPCASNPCTVNGNCLAFNTYFVCSCLNGYSGVTCEVPPNDITRPVLVCPADVTVPATTTSGGAVVTWNLPTVSDNSGDYGFVSVNSESGAYYLIGTVQAVTYTYVDGAGNLATCTFTISVTELDNVDPVVQSCPDDIEITLPPGGVSTVVSWNPPFATDNFAVVSTDNNFSPGDNFDLGPRVVSYTFTDAAGNFEVCSFTVTVTAEPDVSPPVVVNCPGDLDIEVGPNQVSSVATWIEPSATDNVGVVATTNNVSPGASFDVGTTVVTYTFADAAGNPASCSFSVTVIVGEDLVAPIVQNCPGNIAIFVGVGITETAVTWIEPSAVDNSIGTISVDNNYSPGDVFDLGATLVSYTFTDLAGNFATCEFFVGLQVAVDNEDPVIQNCPNDVLLTVANGVTIVTASWIPPTATDNSGSFDTVSTNIPGDMFNLGPNAVTYTFTDPSGNFAVCAFNVIVTVAADVIPPEISNCPGAINIEVSTSLSSATVSWDEPTAEDDSGPVQTIQNFIPGQLFDVGSTAITYTFTDQAGNTAVCTFVVTVTAIDDIAPVIIGCPNTITYEAPLGTTSAPVTWNAPTVSEQGIVVTQTSTPGSVFPLGPTQVTYTFTDVLGNFATCSFTVVIITATDNTRPVIAFCPDDVNIRVDVGVTSGVATWTTPTATDDSGSVNVVSNANPGDSFDLGSTLVTYTFSDDEGNNIICDFFVTVTAESDNIEPVITGCPDDVVLYVEPGTTRASVFWTEPTAVDNFGEVTVTQSSTPGSLFIFGQSQVTYTFRDEANNVAFCIFDVFVRVAPTDESAPAIVTCPGDITVATSDQNTAVPAFWLVPQAVDDSGAVNVDTNANPMDLFFLGTNTVVYTFTDNAGNSIACSFDVNVVLGVIDTTDPIINACPEDIDILTPVGEPNVEVSWNEPSGFDNSGSVTTTQNASPGDIFEAGPTQVVYQFTDASGNDAFCIFTVTVTLDIQTDFDGPVIANCPEDIVLNVPAGISSVTASWQEPTATDASLPITLEQTARPGDQFTVGQTTLVIYTFTDAFGNPSICTFNVAVVATVVDNTDPVISNCPEDINLSVPAGISRVALTWTEPTAVDETSAVLQVQQTASPGDAFLAGQTTVVLYTFTDEAGNDATCSFQIAISVANIDNTDPIISNCPDDISLIVPAGVTSIPVSWTEPTAVDETSAVTVVQNAQPGDNFGLGPNLVSYTFTDAAGNDATCTFVITLTATNVDNTDPVISNCPDNIALNAPAGVTSISVSWTEPTAVDETSAVTVVQTAQPGDNFGLGPNLVSYTFTDAAGNDAICVFLITITATIVDNTDPVVSNCPDNIALNSPAGVTSVPVSWTEPTAVDETSAVTVVQTAQPGDNFGLGPNIVSYTFTDAAGNDAVCSFTITITADSDTTPPVVSGCPSNILATAGVASNTLVSWNEPTATDASGSPVAVTTNLPPGSSFPVGTTLVIYTFTDNSGNMNFCTFEVTVIAANDDIDPVITGCPNDITVTAPTGSTEVAVNWAEPTATDNSGSVTTESTSSPGDSFMVGTTLVIYTFIDDSGNSAQCPFFVSVAATNVDNTDPIISNCPGDILLNVGTGVTSVPVVWTEPTAVDETSAVTVVQNAQPGDNFGLGPNIVSYTFTDAAGNDATCAFIITITAQQIVDNTPPVISNCPNDITLTLPAGTTSVPLTWTAPTAVDETSAVTVTTTANPGDTFIVGTSTDVVYTFTDASGNFDICTFTVTVVASSVDNTPPVVSNCPNDITALVSPGVTSTAVSWPQPSAVDAVSAVTFTTTNVPGSQFDLGSTQVVYTFTDVAGNDAFCVFTVTVATSTGDTTAPMITGCPTTDITVSDIGLDGSQTVTWVEPTATDNSNFVIDRSSDPGDSFPLGTTTVTYTFTDTSNNFAICEFDVIVTATTPCDSNPCPADEQCFYSSDTYLCLPQAGTGRKRRDTEGIAVAEECPCLNDGLCEMDQNDNYRCICKPGFFGPLCENEVVVLDPCQPNPCGRNGTCRHTPRGHTISFVCDCPKGYSGKYCEKVDMMSFSDEQTTKELQQIIKNQTWMSWAFLGGCFVMVITIIILLVGLACLVPRFRTIRTSKPALDEITLVQ